MKLLFKSIGFLSYHLPLVNAFLLSKGKQPYRIVYYHMASNQMPDYYFYNKGVGLDDFNRQLKFYKKHFNVISINQAIEMAQLGESLANCLTISTDDGFKENYFEMAPLLADHQLTSTLYLTNSLIDNQDLMWRNKLAYLINKTSPQKLLQVMVELAQTHQLPIPKSVGELMNWSKANFTCANKDEFSTILWNRTQEIDLDDYLNTNKPYLSTSQISELISAGYEIGAHSLTHPFFDKLTIKEAEKELMGSIEGLEQKFNVAVPCFSYPFGNRTTPNIEQELITKHALKLKCITGIKNQLNNNNQPYSWERDQMEHDFYMSMFRFMTLPIIRKIL